MRFTLHDDQTGKAVTIEADRPPTLQEQEQVYQKAGLRGAAPQSTQTSIRPEDKLPGFSKTMVGLSQGLSNGLRTVGLGAIPDIQAMDAASQMMQKNTGVNPYINSEDIDKKMHKTAIGNVPDLKTAGEDALGAGSWLIPGGEAANLLGRLGLRGILPKLLGYAATGAARGEMYGMSQGQSAQEALPNAAAGSVLEPASLALPFLTKKGVANKATQAAADATKAGKTATFDDIASTIRDNVTKKFGNTVETRQLTDKLIADLTPGEIAQVIPGQAGAPSSLPASDLAKMLVESAKKDPSHAVDPLEQYFANADATQNIATQYLPQTETLTPSKILELRRQASARGGTNWFKKMMGGSDLEDKIANEGRRALSSKLHELAPGTKIPDWLYSKYASKAISNPAVGGDPLRFLLRTALGLTVGKPLEKKIGGILLGE